ncbi:MAG: hypothetical protein WD187_00335 [Candidatus Woykebacteria bacterium]
MGLEQSSAGVQPSAAANAGGQSEFRGDEVGANSSFFITLADGTEAHTFVSASDFRFKENRSSTAGSSIFVDLFLIDVGNPDDYCDDVFQYFYGFADLATDQFDVGRDLSSANLNAMVEVCTDPFDPWSKCHEVKISKLVWGEPGGLYHDWGSNHHRDDTGCRSDSSHNIKSRDAVATGSITFDGQQLAPGPSDWASIYSSVFKDKSRGCFYAEYCQLELGAVGRANPLELDRLSARTAGTIVPAACLETR